MWEFLVQKLVASLCPTGSVFLDVDDTLFHKTGRQVAGTGIFRDAVRSTAKRVVYARGLNLVVLTLRVTPPWGGVELGLPINVRLHGKGDSTYIELAAERVREVAQWLPDCSFALAGDGAYASLAGSKLPRTHVCSRMRWDAALYDKPAPRKKRLRGRPRKKGDRLPAPKNLALQKRGWVHQTVNVRGKKVVRLLLCRKVLWYEVCREQQVLVVLVRDPTGKQRDDCFFTTDANASGESVVSHYAGRWSIEDTFRDVKQLLSGHTTQTWKGQGPFRAAALSFWIYSAVWAWYLATQGTNPSWPRWPWYRAKRTPSFAEALAALRADLWRQRLFPTSNPTPLTPKTVAPVIEILARAA